MNEPDSTLPQELQAELRELDLSRTEALYVIGILIGLAARDVRTAFTRILDERIRKAGDNGVNP